MVGVPAFGLWVVARRSACNLADLKFAQAADEPRSERQTDDHRGQAHAAVRKVMKLKTRKAETES